MQICIKVIRNTTKIIANIERDGTNYFTLSAPNFLNDMMPWEAELRQTFHKIKIALSAFARQDANCLDPLFTSVRNTTKSFGLSGNLNFPKVLTLRLSFAPCAKNKGVITTNEDLHYNAIMLTVLGFLVAITNSYD